VANTHQQRDFSVSLTATLTPQVFLGGDTCVLHRRRSLRQCHRLRFNFLQFKMTAEAKMVGEAWPTAQAVGGQWARLGSRWKAHRL
jgi:hypothetical protein